MRHALLKFVETIEDSSGREHNLIACLLAIHHLVQYAAEADDEQRHICEEEVLTPHTFATIELLFEHDSPGVSRRARTVLDFLHAPAPRPPSCTF